jgi:diacylglycerol kinase family enzyme
MRLDPAVRADMSDNQLDVVFTPFQSRARLIAWTLGMRLRMHLGARDLVYERGSEVHIEGGPAVYQLDGDAPSVSSNDPPALTPLRITLRPRAIKVLLPEGSVVTDPAADCACCDAV